MFGQTPFNRKPNPGMGMAPGQVGGTNDTYTPPMPATGGMGNPFMRRPMPSPMGGPPMNNPMQPRPMAPRMPSPPIQAAPVGPMSPGGLTGTGGTMPRILPDQGSPDPIDNPANAGWRSGGITPSNSLEDMMKKYGGNPPFNPRMFFGGGGY